MFLQSCCFCVPLRVGCQTVAILYLSLNICLLLGWLVFSVSVAATTATTTNTSGHQGSILRDQQRSRLRTLFVDVLLPLAAGSCVGCVTNALLLVAVRRNSRRLIRPWLVWHALLLLVAAGLWLTISWSLFGAVARYQHHEEVAALAAIAAVVSVLGAAMLVAAGFWYVSVLSHYRLLEDSEGYKVQQAGGSSASDEETQRLQADSV